MSATAVAIKVSERPILFSGPMVRAILDGRKTVTRRVVTPQPPAECSIHYPVGNESWLPERDRTPLRHVWEIWEGETYRNRPEGNSCGSHEVRCPYGAPGDRLWVRETWANLSDLRTKDPGPSALISGCFYRADHPAGLNHDDNPAEDLKWRPSIFMRRELSRLTLEITGVRVERLKEMSHSDAVAEGAVCSGDPDGHMGKGSVPKWSMVGDADWRNCLDTAYWAFANGWQKINGKRKGGDWDSNPFVWVITFKPVNVAARDSGIQTIN